jgi:hypothetical protein
MASGRANRTVPTPASTSTSIEALVMRQTLDLPFTDG